MNMRTIDIDFEVHKAIETDRQSFAETPNDVLRRLLGLKLKEEKADPAHNISGRHWAGKGVSLPHGTQLKMEYNGVTHTGRIVDGHWHCEGQIYNGPSAAAGGVAKTRHGSTPSLNGWLYWQTREIGATDWTPISALRTH